MAKVKILHVIAGGDVGGAETFFLEGALALNEHPDIEQWVLTRPVEHRVDTLRAAGIITRTAKFPRFFGWKTRYALRKMINDFKPDLVQYWMGRAGEYAVPSSATETHKNIAWYGGYYNRRKRFPLCSHHITVTKDLQRHVIETGAAPDTVRVIHTIARLPDSSDPQSRAELNTPNDAPVFLALARLHWKKGLDILLRALVKVPKAYVWIAGDGPLKDSLQDMSRQLGVADRVRFLGWRNDRERLLKAADICVFPSRYEPFGTVLIEAWAMRIPLIAAASQGPAAYVDNEKNGLLVPIDDVDALATAMQRCIDDKDLCARIIAGGTTTYQTDFTKEAFLDRSYNFYRQVMAS
jgi:glycosyltransferase involved in cell wall biosynthesis